MKHLVDQALVSQFGLTSFRTRQEEAILSILSGRDTLVVMPTGGGKSLCYQLPALLLEGTALVISPLISLMKDQVDKLKALGIAVAALNSAQSIEDTRAAYRMLDTGELKLLFISPERLENEAFLALLGRSRISFIAVDEAHCISEWGHDFRKSYRRLPQSFPYFQNYVRPPIIALTATATPEVRDDIIHQLQLKDPLEIVTGFERPNLRYAVLTNAQKDIRLIDLLHSIQGSAIVYTTSRARSEKVSLMIRQLGIKASPYHGGIANEVRNNIQNDFLSGTLPVVVATSAFGMGFDKSNVRAVIHYDLPGTLEAYYQESGRAGRDGNEALAILLYNKGDERSHEFMIGRNYPNEDDIHDVYAVLLSSSRDQGGRLFDEPMFFTLTQITQAIGREGIAIKRVLELLDESGVISLSVAGSERSQLYVEITSDRVKIEEYLRRSKNSLGAQLLRYVVNLTKQADKRGIYLSEEDANATLQMEHSVFTQTIRLLETYGLIAVRRKIGFASSSEVVSITLTTPIKPWNEIVLPLSELQLKQEHSVEKLRTVLSYATGWECRSAFLLKYFGERTGTWRCGTCDVCVKK